MRKIIFLLPIVLLFVNCQSKIDKSTLQKINGYWEITSVKTPSGEIKEYTVNTTIDYFELKDSKGFRQKVVPQLDGTYLTNGLKEELTLDETKDQVVFKCKTNYAEWEEEVIKLTEEELVIENDQDIIYHYKRYTPLKITNE